MKSLSNAVAIELYFVTPYAGVWIEIYRFFTIFNKSNVTPYAGVWIEIGSYGIYAVWMGVTPYAGVWIEIL